MASRKRCPEGFLQKKVQIPGNPFDKLTVRVPRVDGARAARTGGMPVRDGRAAPWGRLQNEVNLLW